MPSRFTTLSARSTLICGLCLLATVTAGVTALMIRTHLAESLEKATLLTTAVRNHTTLDMYHDRLRAVVMSALAAGELGIPEKNLRAELEEMSGEFVKVVDANKVLPLSPEIKKDFYAELPIRIRLTGSYHQMGEFVSGIAALPRIVTLDGISIKPESRDYYDNLSFELTAKTFRYLDDAEVAAAEKAKTPAKPGK